MQVYCGELSGRMALSGQFFFNIMAGALLFIHRMEANVQIINLVAYAKKLRNTEYTIEKEFLGYSQIAFVIRQFRISS